VVGRHNAETAEVLVVAVERMLPGDRIVGGATRADLSLAGTARTARTLANFAGDALLAGTPREQKVSNHPRRFDRPSAKHLK
jgi:hypothetical protein